MTTSLQTRLGTAPEESVKAPCVVSTTADITLSGEQTIDSVTVVAGDRVLVRSQTDASENGIYDCKTGAWTRSTDFNNTNDIINGQIVPDANSGYQYQLSYSGTLVLGTTDITFSASAVSVANYFGSAAGTVDAMTVALATTLTAYTDGLEIRVRALGANTVTAPTINVDGLGTKIITKAGGQALLVGDIPRANYEMTLRYNTSSGTFELLTPTGETTVVENMTALRAITPISGRTLYLKSHTTLGDGGQGEFRGVTGAAPGTYTDNDGTIIVPTGGDGSAAWLRELGDHINVRWFGAVADSTGVGNGTDNTAAFTAAFNAAIVTGATKSKKVFIPAGTYRVDGVVRSESDLAASFTLEGETGVHTGNSSGRTAIDLTNNTTYFVAVGYAPRIRDITFIGGVDIIHYSSQGINDSKAVLENISPLKFTGAFLKMFGAGNGSMISLDHINMVANNTTAVVFDNTDLTGTTDSLYLANSWIQTGSQVGFKCKVGRIDVSCTRFIPTNYTADPESTVWFDIYTPCHFSANSGVDFGGESKRRLVNWQPDGGEIRFDDAGISSISATYAVNLIGAPLVISFSNVVVTAGQGSSSLLHIDATMSSSSKDLLSMCRFYMDGVDELCTQIAASLDSTDDAKQLVAKLTHPETDMFLQVSDSIAVGGSSWTTTSAISNVTIVSAASAPDPLGENGLGWKGTATADAAYYSKQSTNGPGVAAIPNGAHTFELLCTVVGGFSKVLLLFGDDTKCFYVGPGVHLLCLPLYITAGTTRTIGFFAYMDNGTEVTITRQRVCKGFYHKRRWEFYGTAVPGGATPFWFRGDRIINGAPTVGQPKAWIATVTGGPGTWVSEGNL